MKKISLFVLLTFLSFVVCFIGCKTEAENETTLESIYISKKPNKTDYIFNSALDLNGIEIKGKYSDGTEKIIDKWTSNPKQGERLTTKGEFTVTISYEGKSTSFLITVTENVTVKYITEYGTIPENLIIEKGETLTSEQLPKLTSNDYFFKGWYDGEILAVAGQYIVNDNVTLTAKWNKKCKIIYITEYGTSPKNIVIEEGITFTSEQLPELEYEDYDFLGWYSGNTKVIAGVYSPTEDTELIARWLKKYTVKYITEYGTVPTQIRVCEGDKFTASQLPNLINNDYFFEGWYIGEEKVDINNYIVTDDIILTAKWKNKCSISYSTDYGIKPETVYIAEGDQLSSTTLPRLLEKGWVFKGWYYSNDFYAKAFAGHGIDKNITLYAKWEEDTGPDDGFIFVDGETWKGRKGNDFYMCDHELTQGEYMSIMGINPSYFNSNPVNDEIQENRPVENITYYDAIYFCNKLSEASGLTSCYAISGISRTSAWNYTVGYGISESIPITCNMNANGYRLPNDWEWFYAANGGNQSNGYKYSGSNNIDDVAWYGIERTHEVKKKNPNELGLYDMSGNVYEWCSSLDTSGAARCYGGCYRSGSKEHLMPTYQNPIRSEPSRTGNTFGLRLVRSDVPKETENTNNEYVFTTSAKVIPARTTENPNGYTCVLFGDWPQTHISSGVKISEFVREIHGNFTYYIGSDGFWYVKTKQKRNSYPGATYSDGYSITEGLDTYFKVEPIMWRVLTNNYNGTGKSLLIAENIVTSGPFDTNESSRIIDSQIIYPNNYQHSYIREYLNKFFYESAFTNEAQNKIEITYVDNSIMSIADSENMELPINNYICMDTNDKLFLLSSNETIKYFPNKLTRIKNIVDFAKANNPGGGWWLRTPDSNQEKSLWVSDSGDINTYYNNKVSETRGIAPALIISLE